MGKSVSWQATCTAAPAFNLGPASTQVQVDVICLQHGRLADGPSALQVQAAAATLADKAATLLDLNERALALRTGSLREPEDDRDARGPRDGGFGDSFQRR